MKDFRLSFLLTILCIGVAAWWGQSTGMGAESAIAIVAILGLMEVSLSFDNAVVNASILKEMDAKWQQLFLTFGILIAVVGMRLLFPIVIVSVATDLDMASVWSMALNRPEEYSNHLQSHHVAIGAFGGIFLLLIFFSFLFDEGKELHWLGQIEEKLSQLGKLDSISIMLALSVLFAFYQWLPIEAGARGSFLIAGVSGIILFIAVSSLDKLFETEESADGVTTTVTRNGIAGFLYLEVLDASFSFDGVIGAFAITRDIVIIMLGLAIGAMFVRSLTVSLVRKGTLDEYVFLEHGAHYAIGALSMIMLAETIQGVHIPEIVTGCIGAGFILFALVTSIRHNRSADSEN